MPLSIKEHACRAHRLPRCEAVIQARAAFLAPRERDLVQAVLVEGRSAESVARLIQITPNAVRYTVRRVARRLASEPFLLAMRSIPALGPTDAHIARRWFCQDATQDQIASELGLTRHGLRVRIERVRALCETIGARRPRQQGAAPRDDRRDERDPDDPRAGTRRERPARAGERQMPEGDATAGVGPSADEGELDEV